MHLMITGPSPSKGEAQMDAGKKSSGRGDRIELCHVVSTAAAAASLSCTFTAYLRLLQVLTKVGIVGITDNAAM